MPGFFGVLGTVKAGLGGGEARWGGVAVPWGPITITGSPWDQPLDGSSESGLRPMVAQLCTPKVLPFSVSEPQNRALRGVLCVAEVRCPHARMSRAASLSVSCAGPRGAGGAAFTQARVGSEGSPGGWNRCRGTKLRLRVPCVWSRAWGLGGLRGSEGPDPRGRGYPAERWGGVPWGLLSHTDVVGRAFGRRGGGRRGHGWGRAAWAGME